MGSWSYRSVWLCHGGAALKSLKFLGGEDGKKEAHEALDYADKAIERHRGTPWEILVRRGSIAIYMPGGD